MRVGTRIAGGFLAVAIVFLLVLVYQVSLIQRMRLVNEKLRLHAQAETVCRDLYDVLDQVDRIIDLHLTRGDADSEVRLQQLVGTLQAGVSAIDATGFSEPELIALQKLQASLLRFHEALGTWLTGNRPARDPEELPDAVRTASVRLEGSLSQMLQIIQASVEEGARESQLISEWSVKMSSAAGVVALLAAFLLAWGILRSITRPLASLIKETRRIAEEDYAARVDESGDDELAELARTFNFTARRLKEIDLLKRDFVSYVSHDLKAPLASMQETTALLLDQIPGPLNSKQSRLLDLNRKCADRLSVMIKNLLDLSRLESGLREYEFRQQDLRPLVHQVVEEIESLVSEKDCSVELELPVSAALVRCDQVAILQVVSNLLDNALRFTPEGTVIGVRVNKLEQLPERIPEEWKWALRPSLGGYVMITIRDSGPGVPESERSRIFDKFHQTQKAEAQGFGLGLAICRTIVEDHYGAIWVDDNPGGGSVFSFLLESQERGGGDANNQR
jgi:signal transduction histidine kinase